MEVINAINCCLNLRMCRPVGATAPEGRLGPLPEGSEAILNMCNRQWRLLQRIMWRKSLIFDWGSVLNTNDTPSVTAFAVTAPPEGAPRVVLCAADSNRSIAGGNRTASFGFAAGSAYTFKQQFILPQV